MRLYTTSQWTARAWATFFAVIATFFATGALISLLADGPRGKSFLEYLLSLPPMFLDVEEQFDLVSRFGFLLTAIVSPLAVFGYVGQYSMRKTGAILLFSLVTLAAIVLMAGGAFLIATLPGIVAVFGYFHVIDLRPEGVFSVDCVLTRSNLTPRRTRSRWPNQPK